jgi:16S rRNA (cytosine1402-N4)-methyltransferase
VRPAGKVFDGTVGLGGHAAAILSRLGSPGYLVGVDRDPQALELARRRLQAVSASFSLYQGLYTEIEDALRAAGLSPEGSMDGILLDLGVSSLQLDRAERGFSFQRSGPLDMRMGSQGPAAAEWLAAAPVKEIADVLRRFGEERHAQRIARAIDRRRKEREIKTTGDLAEVVAAAVPGKRGRIHPATRVFQAIRILVNSELDLLRAFLERVDRYLAPAGRLVVISYHSLEDRLVKELLRRRVAEGIFERSRPAWLRPGEEEIQRNPRARSARLRWAVRRGSV